MKTEISRDSHQAVKRYSGVYQQQGRMLTDADWNELVEILKQGLSESLKDVVGSRESSIGGTPRHRALRVVASGGGFEIQPGRIYIDGMAARFPGDANVAYGDQQDFPGAPDPFGNYLLYADLWERTVTQLMDERLRDKGLHGADTCTRKQTLAQIKWCPYDDTDPGKAENDPETWAKNPRKGDATLNANLLEKTTEVDPCDPCAAELDVASRIGNYLFRLEVHHVDGDADNPDAITLKWSSENGAEQFVAMADEVDMPAGFISDKWVYEFFDETTEKHLGVHLSDSGTAPLRSVLTEISSYQVPDITNSNETITFVRRWDGFCTIDAGLTNLKGGGVDRGVPLDATSAPKSLGHVDLGVSLVIFLESIKLELTLDNKSFVAGDYWLVEVREAEHDPDDSETSKLLVDAPPLGIEHHYLTLGTVVGDALQANPELDRKYAYPPLTEMTRIFMAGGDGQEVMPGEPLPQNLRVGVANGEWPVVGATVRFEIDEGGGSLSPVNGGETDADGIAECQWSPDAVMGTNYRVKANLVDPDHAGDASMDLTPPVYFYANLVTADQVAYDSACEATDPERHRAQSARDRCTAGHRQCKP